MNKSPFSIKSALRLALICSILGIVTFNIITSVKIIKDNRDIHTYQLHALTNTLISQASLSATDLLLDNDQEKLLHLTNNLAQDPLVLDASIYSIDGVRLAASSNAKLAKEWLTFNDPIEQELNNYTQLVKEIYSEQNIIGFVRITFDSNKLTTFVELKSGEHHEQIFTMVGINFIAGILFCLLLQSYITNYKLRRIKHRKL